MRMLNIFTLAALVMFSGLFATHSVLAHHSAIAFDRTETTTVSGSVTKFVWRNPHLSITIDIDGEEWKIEGGSTTEMVNHGFDRNTLSIGDNLTVLISPLKNRRPGGLLIGMAVAGGPSFGMDDSAAPIEQEPVREIPALLAYSRPPAGETWQDREKKTRPQYLPMVSSRPGFSGAGALDPDNLAKPRPQAPFELTGVWAFRGEDEYRAMYGSYEFKPRPQLTAKGQQTWDEFLAYTKEGKRYAEPTAFCYPAGMPRVMTRYGSMMMLQYPTAIFMVSRLNNEYRVIYLDERERQVSNIRDPNWGGESLGHWEGDTLVIDSEGYTNENHMMGQGIFTGNQLKVTERITMLNDGNTLKIDYTFVDPEHWVGEWKHTKFHDRVLGAGADVREANCLWEDNQSLPGMTN